ncbi:hypothetical protein [Agrobacterium tumefaciens]|uniref:hypothetical protein n=1 Tax=Agrobacterium tumefaciens TaxID=358 RepID=UPI0015725EBD|nr:hypothetical protein [Agrobacterium tumefaciens]NTE37642.1 hypothetical protein [Agrobacterium tumefaciens]NTE53154.1 hypothetical protein [Agrobacterium tumefaciens]
MLKYLFAGVSIIASASFFPSESKASEWGCQVLLCLSGDWRGTPSCHPPVFKLIAAMKLPGFSWPICPQANSSAAKFDPYDDCPPGWKITHDQQDFDRQTSPQPSLCRILVDDFPQKVRATSSKEGELSAEVTIADKLTTVRIITLPAGNTSQLQFLEIPRPRREKPYSIEYTDAHGVRQTTWFNLNLP